MDADELEELAQTMAAYRLQVERGICELRRRGATLRFLAELTDMSHETVRRICSKDLYPADKLDRADA